MHLIIVTEIWGRTCHLDRLAAGLENLVSGVSVVDPYGGVDLEFSSEDEAYTHYLDVCGHEEYASKVSQELSKIDGPTCLIGFSAGATAVWSVVCENNSGIINGAICFYGSGIRSMQDHSPEVNTDLILPNYEPHYNVDEVMHNLQRMDLVTCHKASSGHGFMNPLSVNYNEEAYDQWNGWIQAKIFSMLNECSC